MEPFVVPLDPRCQCTHIHALASRASCHIDFTLACCRFVQQSTEEVGPIPPPLTAEGPANVTGEMDLTQSLTGPAQDATAGSRGLDPTPDSTTNINPDTTVAEPAQTAGRRLF